MTVEDVLKRLETDRSTNNELMHYGRKGMKWYQHIFGKETKSSGTTKNSAPSSENRSQSSQQSKSPNRPQSLGQNTTTKIKTSKTKKEAKARARRLSDRDLDQIIKRIEQENRYVSLTYKPSAGSRFGSWLLDNGKKSVSNAATKAGEQALLNYLNKKWPQTKKVK